MSHTGAHSRFQDEAISASDLVIVAVPKDFYTSLPVESFAGKIVVDVSNRSTTRNKMPM